MGYGKRSDFTKMTEADTQPGPGYHNVHDLDTIAKNSVDHSNKH
jgi:hypothetical protein